MPEPKLYLEYDNLSKSVKTIMDLTSRIDERIKILIEQQSDSNEKIEKIMEKNQDIISRVTILETKDINHVKLKVEDLDFELNKKIAEINQKLISLEISTNQNNNKWMFLADVGLKLFMTILTVILSIKLGISF